MQDNGNQVVFKNCVPFIKCITKIDRRTLDDGEDLDSVMTMYNLLECSSSYSDMTDTLRFYYKDEANNFNNDTKNNDNFKFLKY